MKYTPFVAALLLLGCDRVVGIHDLEADLACVPGEERACYSGPAETLDVAPCHAGTMRCAQDGAGFGACVGEVAPTDAITCAANQTPCADPFAKFKADDVIVVQAEEGTDAFQAATNYTASMWLWLDPVTSMSSTALLTARDPAGTEFLEVQFAASSTEAGAPATLAVKVGTAGPGQSELCRIGATQSLPISAWVHLAISVSARNNDESFDVRIFENGHPVAAAKCLALADSPDNLVWTIGGSAFTGRIDDFALERPAKAFTFSVGPSPFNPSACGPAFFSVDFGPEHKASDTRWTGCGGRADLGGSGNEGDAPVVETGLGCQPSHQLSSEGG